MIDVMFLVMLSTMFASAGYLVAWAAASLARRRPVDTVLLGLGAGAALSLVGGRWLLPGFMGLSFALIGVIGAIGGTLTVYATRRAAAESATLWVQGVLGAR
ncbi:hypothetical protein [Kitasatospora sp. NPDC097643]|uniref:hypothetical protein n=1 Tax=Kitasatospora sp. NPDC097643 TaxID=3157230 RepID=UPI00332B1F5E